MNVQRYRTHVPNTHLSVDNDLSNFYCKVPLLRDIIHLWFGVAIRCGPLLSDSFRKPASKLCSNSVVLSSEVWPADEGKALAKLDKHHTNALKDKRQEPCTVEEWLRYNSKQFLLSNRDKNRNSRKKVVKSFSRQ